MSNTTPTAERRSALARARSVIARARERAEALERRRRDLPEAACRVCGGIVSAGEGVRDPGPEPGTPAAAERAVSSWSGPQYGWVPGRPTPETADGWRRAHHDCATMSVRDVVEAVTGVSLTPREAAQMPGVVPVAFQLGRVSDDGVPWSWLSDDERADLTGRARQVRARNRPNPCRDGSCSICGRRDSIGWIVGPMRWSDGTPAPICGDCGPIWERRGCPTDDDDLRRVTYEAITNRPLPLGVAAPAGLRPFAKSRAADRQGTTEPWEYAAEAVADLRLAAWTAYPEYAPEHLRSDFERRRDELRAEAIAAEAAEAAIQLEAEEARHW